MNIMDERLEMLKSIEKELALYKEKLKISQSLIKIGFWELNLANRTIQLSEEAAAIINLQLNKVVLHIDEFVLLCTKEEQNNLKKEFIKLIERRSNLNLEFTLEQNSDLIIKIIANCAEESKEAPNIIIGIVQDITEQKNSEKQLKISKEKAEEADILKSAFLANMSHEIRTPLNAILGFSRLLTNPDIENTQRQEYSEYITSSANNLLNLVRDIMDVSKIEAGKINIEKDKCLINKTLNELKITFEKEKVNQDKEHINIILNTSITNPDFNIYTDPYRFHQIMVNLIGNALKFIEKGYIEFGYLTKGKSQLLFFVKDTGIGIPSDKMEFIFSRFGQIVDNKIKNPGGTGLGLSITKHLVEKLGGEIWVESELDAGTTFYFTLPYEMAENTENNIVEKEKWVEKSDIKKLSLMAVEDDPINMILLEDTLKTYIPDLVFTKARNGIEALDLLKENTFDLIIMDVRMPVMDGYTTTEKIRTEFAEPKKSIPILGLSAHALTTEIEKGKLLGMNDFLSKPILAEQLLSKIKKLCSLNLQITEESAPTELTNKHKFKNIDVDFFVKLFKNNPQKIKKTLNEYLIQIPQQLKMISDSLLNNYDEKTKTTAHSLKSTYKYIGRTDLSEIARAIELNVGNNEKKDTLLTDIQILIKEWKNIEAEIKQYINY